MATNYDLTKLVTLGQLQMALEYIRDLISGGTGDTGTTEPGPVVDPELGSLILTKIINGETEDTDFAFDILVGEELKQITLNKDEDYTIDNLEDGTEFTITETDYKNANSVTYLIDDEEEEYTESASVTGKIVGGEITYISAVNNYASEEEPEPEARTLTIAKEVEGLDDSEVTFDFKVVIAGEEDDPIEFSINTEEEQPITLTDLEGEISVTVTEVDSKNANEIYYSVDGGEFVEGSEVVATIAEDVNDMMIVFKNVYKKDEEPEPEPTTGSITVSKFIEGATDKSEFSFRVELSNDTTEEFTINTDESNEHTIDVEFSDEDEDIWYTITEVDSEADLVEWDIDEIITEGESVSGYMVAGEAVEVVVTNTYNGEEPEPEPDPEPEPEPTAGTVTVSKVVEGTTDDSWYIFEIKTDAGECKRTFLANGESHTVKLTADSEFTVEELEKGSADTVTYSIDGSEAVEGTVATGTVVGGSNVSVVFTNTYEEKEEPEPDPEPETGIVTISKQVDGETDATDFEFELTYGDITKQFNLNDDTSESFEIEVGTEYTVMETDPKGADSVSYSVDDDELVDDVSYTGVVVEGDTNITFVNTYIEEEPEPEPMMGFLEITKQVDGDTEDSDYSFEITDSDGNVVYSKVMNDGDAEEFVLYEGTYTITETDSKSADFVKYVVDDGKPVINKSVEIEIIADETVNVVCTNAYYEPETVPPEPEPDPEPVPSDEGTLTISKSVDGDTEDSDYVIEVTDSDGSVVASETFNDGDSKDFTLTDGMYTVTETDPKKADVIKYSVNGSTVVSGKSVEVEVVGAKTVEVAFTNAYYEPETVPPDPEPDPDPDPEPTPDPEPEPLEYGTLTISKLVNGTTEDSEFVFEVVGEDGIPHEYKEDGGQSTDIKLEVGKYTITETDSKNADSIGYSLNGGDPVYEKSVEVEIGEEDNISVEFTNYYLYVEPTPDGGENESPEGVTIPAGTESFNIVLDSNADDISVACNSDKVTYELVESEEEPGIMVLRITGSESSEEDYDVVFEITSTLGDKVSVITYTVTFTANIVKMGTLSITKSVSDTPVNTPDRGTYKFELTVGDGEAEEIEISKGETVEKEIKANTEFTLKEVNSEEADMVTYTVDDGDSVEGDTVTGTVEEDGTVNIDFRNTYLYFYQSSNKTTMKANNGSLFIVLNTNGTPTVTCDNEEMIEWELSGKTIRMLGSKSSTEDYTVVFTIVCTLDNGKSITGTYTILFTADLEPTSSITVTKTVEGDTDTKEFNFNVKYGEETEDHTIAAGESFTIEGLEAGTEYTVTEVDPDAETVTYTVDDDEAVEGNEVSGVVDGEGNDISIGFTNTYPELYLTLNPDHSTTTAGRSNISITPSTNGTITSVICDRDDMVDWELVEAGGWYANAHIQINSSKSYYEDYDVTFTITAKLGDSVAIATYVLTFEANEEKLDDLVLNPDNSTATAGFGPITIVFSTNGTPSVECDSDKIDWELKEPGGIFAGYQIVINSSEESDEDYVVHFTITCTLGDDQTTSAVYTLTFTANN